jgi:O-antigen/teichoic acid export membrane protein
VEFLKVLLSRGIPAVGVIIYSILIARILSIDDTGIIFLWISIIYFSSLISRLGFEIYFLKEVSIGNNKFIPAAKKLVFAISILISILITSVFNSENLFYLIFSLPFFSLCAINSSILRAENKIFAAGLTEVSSISMTSASIITFVYYFKLNIDIDIDIDIGIISIIFFASSFLVFSISEYMIDKENRGLNSGLEINIKYIKESIPFLAAPLIIYSIQWIPIYFLGLLSTKAVAVFGLSVKIASGFAFFAISLDSYIAPKFAKLHATGKLQEAKDIIKSTRWISGSVIFIFFSIYLLFGESAILNILGAEYKDVFLPALAMMLSYAIILMIGPYQYYLLMSSGQSAVTKSNAMAMLIAIFGCFLLFYFKNDTVLAYSAVIVSARIYAILIMRRITLASMALRK